MTANARDSPWVTLYEITQAGRVKGLGVQLAVDDETSDGYDYMLWEFRIESKIAQWWLEVYKKYKKYETPSSLLNKQVVGYVRFNVDRCSSMPSAWNGETYLMSFYRLPSGKRGNGGGLFILEW